MKTLIIYDDNGTIFYMQKEPFSEPRGGLRYMVLDIPDGLSIKSIDTHGTADKPVYYEQVTGDVIAATIDKVNTFQNELDALRNTQPDEDIGTRSDTSGTDTLWGRLKMLEFILDVDSSHFRS